MAVRKPEELADNIPILLSQPIVVLLNLWNNCHPIFIALSTHRCPVEPVDLPIPLYGSPPAMQPLLLPAVHILKCLYCWDFMVEVNNAPEMADLTVPSGDHSPQPSLPG